MNFNPDLHRRRSIRLENYDYTRAGAYFVTICTFERECLFGEVVEGVMGLNRSGEIVRDEWLMTDELRNYVVLDEFMVMPNHFHAILVINNVGATRWVALDGQEKSENRATQRVAPTPGPVSGSIGAIIGQFKSAAPKRINQLRNNPGGAVWQRNYYERVIRDDRELDTIRQYIADNPARWADDENYLPHTG
jgi:REP element-mobilizing transposase RayT